MTAPSGTTLIDRVDLRDERVGTIERARALATGANFRTAHVFVENSAGGLLLQRLAPTRERHPGRWGSSVAAYLYAGESYEAGARRRLAEELHLEADLRRVGKMQMQDERSIKFVALFHITSDWFEIGEPDHIATAQFWPVDSIRASLELTPCQFTPTFRRLFEFFSRLRPT